MQRQGGDQAGHRGRLWDSTRCPASADEDQRATATAAFSPVLGRSIYGRCKLSPHLVRSRSVSDHQQPSTVNASRRRSEVVLTWTAQVSGHCGGHVGDDDVQQPTNLCNALCFGLQQRFPEASSAVADEVAELHAAPT